ncbi:RyR domain-containing protein [Streptomyces californicus]|uniref:RyR domain-containing protein n=1 Tax=Streptomyces californicus TaxID=67351 RepID=UPI0035DC5AB9
MIRSTDEIARIAYEANRALQRVTGDPASSLAWDDAPEWQRASAVDGVEQALAGASPESLHEAWCAYKRADGWTYGVVKNGEAKTHPCLVPYADLPDDQRQKDELFHAVVQALA